MAFAISRGLAEVQILKKSGSDLISWTEWDIVMQFCIQIDIDQI